MSDGATAMYEEEMLEHGWHEYADKYDQPPLCLTICLPFGNW